MRLALDDLRRFAVTRSLFPPTTLKRAIARLGFVQADPIRAPARTQDLTLRHRVANYRAGDLERRYPALGVEEDVFINYGFVTRDVQALMHPRTGMSWSSSRRKRAEALLEFVRERGEVHPREVDAHFAHGTVTNYWGGSSSATTHLLDEMHYYGLLRISRRETGIRIYAVRAPTTGPVTADGRDPKIDALVDVLVRKYAPLPAASLPGLVGRLRYAVPQWRGRLKGALSRARERLSSAHVDGIGWYWPADERPGGAPHDSVHLLSPFDPLVWDRRRFELLWGWTYRFEAYTPVSKRKLGYYALPMLWRDRVIGWANLTVRDGALQSEFGYVSSPPSGTFSDALEAELERVRRFLGIE